MLAVRASSCLAVALRRRRVQTARVACSLSQCPGTHGTGNMAAREQRDKESYSDDDEQGSEIESCPDCRHEDTLCESCWQEVRPPSDYGNTDSDETTDTDTDTDTDAETSRATTMHHHYYAPAHVETHHHYYPAAHPPCSPAYAPAMAPPEHFPASQPHQLVGNYDFPDYSQYRSNSSDSSSEEDQEEKPKTSAQQKESTMKSNSARGRTQ